MKKFLALGLLAAFFLVPSVQARDWHGARGKGYYQSHRQDRPGGGYYDYDRAQYLRQLKWRNHYYWGNHFNRSGWQQYQSRRGYNDYHQRMYDNRQLHRNEIWGSQPIGPGYYHRPGRHFNDSCYR